MANPGINTFSGFGSDPKDFSGRPYTYESIPFSKDVVFESKTLTAPPGAKRAKIHAIGGGGGGGGAGVLVQSGTNGTNGTNGGDTIVTCNGTTVTAKGGAGGKGGGVDVEIKMKVIMGGNSSYDVKNISTNARTNCLAYGNGVWVATNLSGNITTNNSGPLVIPSIMISDDGFGWEKVESSDSTIRAITWVSVYFENGAFYAFQDAAAAAGGFFITSTDGKTWTKISTPSTTAYIYSIRYMNGYYYLACGNTTTTCYRIANWSSTYEPITMPSGTWYDFCWNQNTTAPRYIAVSGGVTAYSSNGTTWSSGTTLTTATYRKIAFTKNINSSNGGIFVTIGTNALFTEWYWMDGNNATGTWNATTGSQLSANSSYWHVEYCPVDNKFYFLSHYYANATIYGNGYYFMSADGKTSSGATSLNLYSQYSMVSGLTYGNNMLLAIPNSSYTNSDQVAICKYNFNSTGFQSIGPYILASTRYNIKDIAYNGSYYCAISFYGTYYGASLISSNGYTWDYVTMNAFSTNWIPMSIVWHRSTGRWIVHTTYYTNGSQDYTYYYYSSDGKSWPSASQVSAYTGYYPGANQGYDGMVVTSNDYVFAYGGYSNRATYSGSYITPSGSIGTISHAGNTYGFSGAAYLATGSTWKYLISYYGGGLYGSNDLSSWTQVNGNLNYGVISGNGKFVACYSNLTDLYQSSTGTSFTLCGSFGTINGFWFSKGLFYVDAANGLFVSTDAINWEKVFTNSRPGYAPGQWNNLNCKGSYDAYNTNIKFIHPGAFAHYKISDKTNIYGTSKTTPITAAGFNGGDGACSTSGTASVSPGTGGAAYGRYVGASGGFGTNGSQSLAEKSSSKLPVSVKSNGDSSISIQPTVEFMQGGAGGNYPANGVRTTSFDMNGSLGGGGTGGTAVGSSTNNITKTICYSGSGGQGGGYSTDNVLLSGNGDSITVTIGAGGAGGINNYNVTNPATIDDYVGKGGDGYAVIEYFYY